MQRIFESSLLNFVTYPFQFLFNMLSFFNCFRLIGNSEYKYKKPEFTCALSSQRIKEIEQEVKKMMEDFVQQNQDFSEDPVIHHQSDQDLS